MNSVLSFTPLTRAGAAKVMKKSERTLDNWCAEGEMPEPATLGGSRFWHPDLFYGWLDAKLKGQVWDGELAAQAVPGGVSPFEPLTREEAADILQKSVRTLEGWYEVGVMPEPAVVGGTRYWHPEIFFGWLDARLKGRAWPSAAALKSTQPGPALFAHRAGSATVPKAAAASSAPAVAKRAKTAERTTASARGRARDAALLREMNSP